MWQAILYVSSAVTLAAFIGAIALAAYRQSLKRQGQLLQAFPENDRLKAVEQILGRFHVDTSNLTKEQQFKLATQQIEGSLKKTRLAAIVVVVIAFLASVVLVVALTRERGQPPEQEKRAEPPTETSLNFRLEPYIDDATDQEGPNRSLGEPIMFTLSNPLTGLAIIDSISLEVLDQMEDKYAYAQTILRPYKYEVKLGPKDVGRTVQIVNKSFSYKPGDVDRILCIVKSERMGIDYFVRLLIKWRDDVDGAMKTICSDVIVLKFPLVSDDGLSREEVGRRADQHDKKIKERIQRLREKYPQIRVDGQ